MNKTDKLLILGNGITALAMVRSAYKHMIRPILFSRKAGIAFKSSLAEKILFPLEDDEKILHRMKMIKNKQDCYVIAAEDDWIRFIMKKREWFDLNFKKVLHAHNKALKICLDKDEFAAWCKMKDLVSPICYDVTNPQQKKKIKFPVIMRPVNSSIGQYLRLPKAVQIHDMGELDYWINNFQDVNVDFLITESLLGQRLKKFSVAIARHDNKILSYVAEQLRPNPEKCATGTYVKLTLNPKVEALARKTAELLDYYGIGELEILYSADTNKSYLIEFNARPWLQYSLAEATNHCMLKFLINSKSYQSNSEIKTGLGWINFTGDLFTCFSRSKGCVRAGCIDLSDYVKSLSVKNSGAVFDWKDPFPALFSMRDFLLGLIRNRFRKTISRD